MKNAIVNIFVKIGAFIKAHTVLSIVVGAVVLTTAIATPVAIYVLKDELEEITPYTESSIPELDEKLEEQAEQQQEEGLPSQAEQEAEEQTQQETVGEAVKEENNTIQTNSQQSVQQTQTTTSTTTNNTSVGTSNNVTTNSATTSVQPQVVQHADTKTGISWDGKSPIIYTYPDGTTGTTPIEGATYESVPGLITTYYILRDLAGRPYDSDCSICGKKVGSGQNNKCLQVNRNSYCGDCGVYFTAYTCHTCAFEKASNDFTLYCTHCGKISGTGINGTCLRYWTVGEHVCINCGTTVPTNTCHTCTSGCMYCKKTMGNGSNGTCYREYFNQSKCPSCNVAVPKNTCHSCN